MIDMYIGLYVDIESAATIQMGDLESSTHPL